MVVDVVAAQIDPRDRVLKFFHQVPQPLSGGVRQLVRRQAQRVNLSPVVLFDRSDHRSHPFVTNGVGTHQKVLQMVSVTEQPCEAIPTGLCDVVIVQIQMPQMSVGHQAINQGCYAGVADPVPHQH